MKNLLIGIIPIPKETRNLSKNRGTKKFRSLSNNYINSKFYYGQGKKKITNFFLKNKYGNDYNTDGHVYKQ